MSAGLARALESLYQAALSDFTRERDRLVAELRAAGDRAAAAEIARRRRPTLSAWAVNQLYRREREAFDEMLHTAERVRAGERGASRAHHDAVAELRHRAAALLSGAGHAASDDALRRVATNLAAISAADGFAPDSPGALAADREAPGFAALGVASDVRSGAAESPRPAPSPRSRARAAPASGAPGGHRARAARAARDQHRARALDERLRRQAERARTRERKARDLEARRRERAEETRLRAERAGRRSERRRLEKELRAARTALRSADDRAAALERELGTVRERAAEARRAVAELERKLVALAD